MYTAALSFLNWKNPTTMWFSSPSTLHPVIKKEAEETQGALKSCKSIQFSSIQFYLYSAKLQQMSSQGT